MRHVHALIAPGALCEGDLDFSPHTGCLGVTVRCRATVEHSRAHTVDSRRDFQRHTGHRVSIGERCHDESECRITRIAYDSDRTLSDERASRAKTGDQRDVSSRSVVVNAALEVTLRALTNEMCGPSIAV